MAGAGERVGEASEVTRSQMLSRLSEFIKDVRIEAGKVTWPTRKELQESTMVVVVTVAIISIFTAIVDRVVVRVITLVI